MKKRILCMSFLSLLLMTACDSEDEMTFDEEFKVSIEEEPVQLAVENGGLLLSFYPSGLVYYGLNEYIDNYDIPFEQTDEDQDYTEYQDYTVAFDEETDLFTVTIEEGVYELEMLGPRVFWDEENSMNITSNRAFINE
ncbi:hypothetical protein [Alkalibacterium sp. MB6]|uniref:hypothetical protein n=1 Tax=Alkalibacterium sp. MB6 TaxID=2081965 RepID=UPI00137B1699|nr:hypothetical protein [Alkalibacterium sp. MB6]